MIYTTPIRMLQRGRRLRSWRALVAEMLHYFDQKTLINSAISVSVAVGLPIIVGSFV